MLGNLDIAIMFYSYLIRLWYTEVPWYTAVVDWYDDQHLCLLIILLKKDCCIYIYSGKTYKSATVY